MAIDFSDPDTKKKYALVGAGVVAVLALIWVYWPAGAPPVDPRALEAMNDPEANPPVADVPPPTDGPRRKAVKVK